LIKETPFHYPLLMLITIFFALSLPRSERVWTLGQGRALPTELFSQKLSLHLIHCSWAEARFSLKAAAKIRFFFNFQNVLGEKYREQIISCLNLSSFSLFHSIFNSTLTD